MVVIAAALAALTAFVLVYTLTTPGRGPTLRQRLSRYDRSAAIDRDALLALPFIQRVGVPIFGRLQSLASLVLPQTVIGGIERRLVIAGEPTSLHAFLTVQFVFAGGSAIAGLALVGARLEWRFTALGLAGLVLVAVLPVYWLYRTMSGRQTAIRKALPDAVDLVVTTVEAGLAIDAALAEVGRETDGPLGDELRLTVRETTLGRARRDALQGMIDRTAVPELRTFIQAIIQAEQTGVPVGQVLRSQAAQLRIKRRQRAEAMSQRAPVKMVLVLVTLVLPAMLLCVMGPAAIRISDAL